ncbi:MAG: NusG domain II-containing protein [Clostridiales bacterium]|nr:NusG domain II-containing protein [Clostridiales bacterium]
MKNDIKNNKKLYKNDFLLIFFVIILTVAATIPLYFFGKTDADCIAVYIDGKEYARFSLLEDADTEISDVGMTLKIQDGKAFVTDSDCPDKTCKGMSISASSSGSESIICIPNKVVIKKVSSKDGNGKGVNVVAG